MSWCATGGWCRTATCAWWRPWTGRVTEHPSWASSVASGCAGALAPPAWAWDSPLLLAVGKSPEDLQCALTRLVSLGGGVVVCAGEEVLAELAAPVAGVVSVDPLEEVARREVEVDQALRGLGAVGPRPSLTVDVLAGLAIPHFRVCDRGYVRVRDGAILGLWPDGA